MFQQPTNGVGVFEQGVVLQGMLLLLWLWLHNYPTAHTIALRQTLEMCAPSLSQSKLNKARL